MNAYRSPPFPKVIKSCCISIQHKAEIANTFLLSFSQPMIEKIIAANGTAGVDAVTGATHSSDGIKGAVEAALAAAL